MAETEKSKSVFDDKTVSDDYKTGGAYKAILKLFSEQLEDDKFAWNTVESFLKEKRSNMTRINQK